jgi:SSS family solute:Na+ symporter
LVANIIVGIIWQTGLTAIGIYIVLEDWKAMAYCAAVVAATSTFLKFNWYDKLRDYPDHVDMTETV